MGSAGLASAWLAAYVRGTTNSYSHSSWLFFLLPGHLVVFDGA